MQNLSLQTRNIAATAFPPLLFRGIRLTLFLKIYVYYEYHICDILRVWLRFMLLFTFFFDFPFCTWQTRTCQSIGITSIAQCWGKYTLQKICVHWTVMGNTYPAIHVHMYICTYLGMSLPTKHVSLYQPLFNPPSPSFRTFVKFFYGLGDTLHCSKIGQYKA